MNKYFGDLISALSCPAHVEGDPELSISSLCLDSRQVVPGALFFCLPGNNFDGSDFVDEAISRGAVAIMGSKRLDCAVAQLVVEPKELRPQIAKVSAKFWDNPSKGLTTIGITGTNGKTTVTKLTEAILTTSGAKVAINGTLSGQYTTPESPILQEWIYNRAGDQCDFVAMEVSSHGLETCRVDEILFDLAVFTNLSHDHLDFHETMEKYFQAKARLFTIEHSKSAIINTDTTWGSKLVELSQVPTQTCDTSQAKIRTESLEGTSFEFDGIKVYLRLIGRHNVSNAICAIRVGQYFGVSNQDIVAGLESVTKVDGRSERISAGQDFEVLVDFAHTPDALETTLKQVRSILGDGRLILVFGCGGMRDTSKRPVMGQIGAQLADLLVITSDNPRDESPMDIIGQIVEGIDQLPPEIQVSPVIIEPNREWAIHYAIGSAATRDVVVIAGKGHETYQDLGDRVLAFDDRKVALRALMTRLGQGPEVLLSHGTKTR